MPKEKLKRPKALKAYDIATESRLNRLIYKNNALIKDIEKIRHQYNIKGSGFPKEFEEFKQDKGEKKVVEVYKDVIRLYWRYDLPSDELYDLYIGNIWSLIWNKESQLYLDINNFHRWTPFNYEIILFDRHVEAIVIFPENDLDDPNVISNIKTLQKRILGKIPQPRRIPGNKHGKLD